MKAKTKTRIPRQDPMHTSPESHPAKIRSPPTWIGGHGLGGVNLVDGLWVVYRNNKVTLTPRSYLGSVAGQKMVRLPKLVRLPTLCGSKNWQTYCLFI